MGQASLDGVRVLELGGWMAAPFAGHLLAQLGAEVIKIEPIDGEPTRKLGVVEGMPGGTFLAYNVGKQDLCLNLNVEEGHEVFDRLLTTADVVLHNLAPNAALRLKVTEEDCHRVNPDLIYCQIRGYGPGPLANDIASNPIIEASTGVMFTNRINGRPSRLGPSYHDMFAGAYAVIGILAEMMSHSDEENVRQVEVGLFEVGLHVAGNKLIEAQLKVETEAEQDSRTEFGFPGYAAYETSDGRWIYLVMLNDDHWRRFCQAMSLTEGNDESLATTRQRQLRYQHVDEIVARSIRSLPFNDTSSRLGSVGFGWTEVLKPEDVLSSPQTLQPGKVVNVTFAGHEFSVPNFPVLSQSVRSDLNSPPPTLGRDTLAIMYALGYDESTCEALFEIGALSRS
jgi:crotonobetainyl-CoA:carnitine CoA-transferase CaiB-like acyl-CoA transferase